MGHNPDYESGKLHRLCLLLFELSKSLMLSNGRRRAENPRLPLELRQFMGQVGIQLPKRQRGVILAPAANRDGCCRLETRAKCFISERFVDLSVRTTQFLWSNAAKVG